MLKLRHVAGSEVIELMGLEDWLEITASGIDSARRRIEEDVLRSPYPRLIRGFCSCCNKFVEVEFSTRHALLTKDGGIHLSCSETGVCPQCRINSRMRFACDFLFSQVNGGKVYLTEKKTYLVQSLMKRHSDLETSEFLGFDKICGQEYDGVIHQNIENLSYSADSFSGVMCLDVLEHVFDPIKALSEISRVLSPGGTAVITFPFFCDRERTVRRASLDNNGTLRHDLAPEYHGNPLGGGVLVVNEFSWDFIEEVKRSIQIASVKFVNYWSIYRAHFGRARFALIFTK